MTEYQVTYAHTVVIHVQADDEQHGITQAQELWDEGGPEYSEEFCYKITKETMVISAKPSVSRVSVIVHGDAGAGVEYESFSLSDVQSSYQDDGRT
jgi:hypothetical protein